MIVVMLLVILVSVHDMFHMVFVLVLLKRFHCLFANGITRYFLDAILRHDYKGALKISLSNWYLHYANPRDKLNATYTFVAKS